KRHNREYRRTPHVKSDIDDQRCRARHFQSTVHKSDCWRQAHTTAHENGFAQMRRWLTDVMREYRSLVPLQHRYHWHCSRVAPNQLHLLPGRIPAVAGHTVHPYLMPQFWPAPVTTALTRLASGAVLQT